MRGIAGKDNPVMAEFFHPPTLKAVDADPFQIEVHIAQHRLQTQDHALGLFLGLLVDIRPKLQVDAPDPVGLLVQQRGLAGIEGRVEPEPPLGREIGLHDHIRDQEIILEHAPHEIEAQQLPTGRSGAVAGDYPVGGQLIGAVRRLDPDRHMIGLGVQRDDPRLAANFHRRARRLQGVEAQHKLMFQMILLQVDEGRAPMPILGQQVEFIDLTVAEKHLSDIPDDALFHQRLGATQPVEDFQGPLGKADRAAAKADAVIVVQHHGLNPALRQIDGGGQPDRPRPDNRDTVPAARTVLFRAAGIGIDRRLEDAGHPVSSPPAPAMDQPCRAAHMSLSRWAVQMRGCSIPSASS